MDLLRPLSRHTSGLTHHSFNRLPRSKRQNIIQLSRVSLDQSTCIFRIDAASQPGPSGKSPFFTSHQFDPPSIPPLASPAGILGIMSHEPWGLDMQRLQLDVTAFSTRIQFRSLSLDFEQRTCARLNHYVLSCGKNPQRVGTPSIQWPPLRLNSTFWSKIHPSCGTFRK